MSMASAGRSFSMAMRWAPGAMLCACAVAFLGGATTGGSAQSPVTPDNVSHSLCKRIAGDRNRLVDALPWSIGSRTAKPANVSMGRVATPELGTVFVGAVRVQDLEAGARTPAGKTPSFSKILQVPIFILGAPADLHDAATDTPFKLSAQLSKINLTNQSASNATDLITVVSMVKGKAEYEVQLLRTNDVQTPYLLGDAEADPLDIDVMLWAMPDRIKTNVTRRIKQMQTEGDIGEPVELARMALAVMPPDFSADQCAGKALPATVEADTGQSIVLAGLPSQVPSPLPRPETANDAAYGADSASAPTNGDDAVRVASDATIEPEGSDNGTDGLTDGADQNRSASPGEPEKLVTFVEWTQAERPAQKKAGLMVIVGPAALALKIDGLAVSVRDGAITHNGRLALDEATKFKLEDIWRNNPLQVLRVLDVDGGAPLDVGAGSDAPTMRLTAEDGTQITLRGERSAPDGATFYSYVIGTPEVCGLGILTGAACPRVATPVKPAPADPKPKEETVANDAPLPGLRDDKEDDETATPEEIPAPVPDPVEEKPKFSSLDVILTVEIRGLPARIDYGNYVRACRLTLLADLEPGLQSFQLTRVSQDGQFLYRLVPDDIGDLALWRLLTEEAPSLLSLSVDDVDDGKPEVCAVSGSTVALSSIAPAKDQEDVLVAKAVAPPTGPLFTLVFAYGELKSGDVYPLEDFDAATREERMKSAVQVMSKNIWSALKSPELAPRWSKISGIDILSMYNTATSAKIEQIFPLYGSDYKRSPGLGKALDGRSGDQVVAAYAAGQPTIAKMASAIGSRAVRGEGANYRPVEGARNVLPDVVMLVRMKKTLADACDTAGRETRVWAKERGTPDGPDARRIKEPGRGLRVIQIIGIDDTADDFGDSAEARGDVLYACKTPEDVLPSYIDETLVMSISDRLSGGGWRDFQTDLKAQIERMMREYR